MPKSKVVYILDEAPRYREGDHNKYDLSMPFTYSSKSKTLQKSESVKMPNYGFVLCEHFDRSNVIDRLNVLLLGNDRIPSLEEYRDVKKVQFSGHLSYMKAAFCMTNELKTCESVQFYLAEDSQLPIYREGSTIDLDNLTLPVMDKVKELYLHVNMSNYFRSSEEIKTIVGDQIKAVLVYSKVCFPKLTMFDISIPRCRSHYKMVGDFVKFYPILASKYQTLLDGDKVKVKLLQERQSSLQEPLPPPKLVHNGNELLKSKIIPPPFASPSQLSDHSWRGSVHNSNYLGSLSAQSPVLKPALEQTEDNFSDCGSKTSAVSAVSSVPTDVGEYTTEWPSDPRKNKRRASTETPLISAALDPQAAQKLHTAIYSDNDKNKHYTLFDHQNPAITPTPLQEKPVSHESEKSMDLSSLFTRRCESDAVDTHPHRKSIANPLDFNKSCDSGISISGHGQDSFSKEFPSMDLEDLTDCESSEITVYSRNAKVDEFDYSNLEEPGSVVPSSVNANKPEVKENLTITTVNPDAVAKLVSAAEPDSDLEYALMQCADVFAKGKNNSNNERTGTVTKSETSKRRSIEEYRKRNIKRRRRHDRYYHRRAH